MKLSILDQAPISSGQSAKEALEAAIQLAQFGEKYEYERYWIAEHHDLAGLACPNPEVMISAIGAHTETIRIGAGAVLLPYYKPFRVAETYNLLATLYPGRIDLGIGRAPGGSAEVSLALSDNYLKGVREYPDKIDDLLTFLYGRFPKDHMYHTITASPQPETPPETWLLGTSEKSAKLAIEKQLNYSFGHFMTDANGPEIVRTYRQKMLETYDHPGKVIVAVQAVCAETDERAEEIALSSLVWRVKKESSHYQKVPSIEEAQNILLIHEEKKKIENMKQKIIIGSPATVKKEFQFLQKIYEADEFMIITIVHDLEDKRSSYRLIREALA